MRSINRKLTDRKSLIIMLSIILVFALFCLTQPLYTDIDNYVMSAFVHDLYGEDNYIYYLNPVLCKIIKWLNFFLPTADNMILVFRVVVFSGFCILLFIIFQTNITAPQKTARVLCLWILSAISVAANFTVVAAFACMTGSILIGYSIRKKNWALYGILGILFYLMGVMIRVNVGELFIPFVVLNMFIVVLADRTHVKRALVCGAVFFVCIGVVKGIDLSVSGGETYREYVRYNNARSNILDYPVKEYDQVSQQLANAGISENEYWCLRGYIQFDTDLWTPSRLEEAAEIVSSGNAYIGRPATAFLRDLAKGLTQDRWIFIQMAGLTFLCIFALKNMGKLYKLGSILVWLGSVLIILYFTFIGRCPVRLYQAILFGAWGCVWTWLGLSDIKGQAKIKYSYFGNVVLVIVAAGMMWNLEYVYPQNIFRVNNGGEEYRSIEGEITNVYIWNVSDYNTYMCQHFADKGKLPARDFLRHNFPAGGWRYGHKSYYDFLEANEIENLMDKLINDSTFFFIGDEWTAERVNNHMHEYWEEMGNLEKKSEVEGRVIWEYKKTTPESYAE